MCVIPAVKLWQDESLLRLLRGVILSFFLSRGGKIPEIWKNISEQVVAKNRLEMGIVNIYFLGILTSCEIRFISVSQQICSSLDIVQFSGCEIQFDILWQVVVQIPG